MRKTAVISSQLSLCWIFSSIQYQSWICLPLDPFFALSYSVFMRTNPYGLHLPGCFSEDSHLGLANWKQWWETGGQEVQRSRMFAFFLYAAGICDSCCIFSMVLAPTRQDTHDSIFYSVMQWPVSLGSSNTASYFCFFSPGLVAPSVFADLWVASLFGWPLTLF